MIINAKIARLEVDAELAWFDGDEIGGRKIDAKISKLEHENGMRLTKAKSKFETFSQEIQDSAMLNAGQTAINQSQTKFFHQIGGKAFGMCEFWEAAAESALFLSECNFKVSY